MQITMLAIGSRMPGWVEAGVQTYQKRLPRQLEFRIRALGAPLRSAAADASTRRRHEADTLLGAVPAGAHVVALDERGALWTSAELAQQLERWQAAAGPVALLTGGADGLDPSCREQADQVWSLSPLTLPHALVRVVVAEQLYRAWTLLQGHPYHRS
ncbi:MAG: 23S rRNA (pseudouridine(1915)-N(3))-methyltransferase RlmH [Gammaproteobacteria bacterium]|nr:23S rRNA (pseudouridine(1915)-N(3))-methyltransferase RlmH [Gammaproteobacteria bacterium]